MDSKQAKEILPILTAFSEGKEIQYRDDNMTEKWRDISNVSFEWPASHYRIKPEPRVFYGIEGAMDYPSLYSSEEDRDAVFDKYKRDYPSWKKLKVIEQL